MANTATCTRCHELKPLSDFFKHKRDGHSSWCKQCSHKYYLSLKDTGYFKEYNQRPEVKIMVAHKTKKYVDSHPDLQPKIIAKNRLNWAVIGGHIKKLPCKICGNIKVQAHHPDYSKPLDVIWLCRKHHKELHQGGLL